ncbi:guanylate-binding protein 1-like [Eublepharis macularius]|uniref:Guanylate-binding protein 1-like n=1 Tax=Eublepharis macularius TaxID=481883 RepID=A0AA97KG84_EUBMA|nr:guanylate-binding protein 1-like [Eublepharis macularius]XP_054855525.1 guanylate-binding protein 1-like [Eublepharis macularius]
MASRLCMPSPVCLIENRDRKLVVHREALQLLSGIHQPVVVVAIVGLYRTGKSYLMNKLAGKNSGFNLGSTVQASTKGIWMWCVPYPGKPDQTLVLLDTEGLGDVEKGDAQNDSWIFALAVLLSSTLVYNSMGTIDQRAMDQLHYVTELTERIKSKSSPEEDSEVLEDSAEYVRFFPSFIWALRDFTLQLELYGKTCTEDEYLENALKLKEGNSREVQLFNLPRECIRLFFPTRKCFIFDRPTNRKNLHHLEEMEEDELEPEFVEQARQFCRHVYRTSKPKTIPGGHIVTGRLLANLVETYVDTIRSGGVPCMENAVLALAQIENSAAVLDATARYEELMDQKLQLPTETLQELLGIHAKCEDGALQVFMARAFKDDKQQFQAELMRALDQKKEAYCHMNVLESSKCCKALLARLSKELEDRIHKAFYSRPGGYRDYFNDVKNITVRYHQEPGKGVMADAELQQFFKGKEDVGRAILQSDEALTEKEKEAQDAKARAEAAEREKEIQKQQQAALEQKLEDQRRSHEANIQYLKEKMERDREKLLEEQNKMMDSKLREQKAMLDAGFQKRADELNEQIGQLRRESENVRKPSWISSILDAASLVLPGVFGKAVGVLSNLLGRI